MMDHTMTRPRERAPYGRQRDGHRADEPWRDGHDGHRRNGHAPVPTYYGLPAVKRSHYGWLIATYFFVGGLAGFSQIIATVADLRGRSQDRGVVRAGRYLALAGALASPLLLIKDLHTPSRWYNMLRIVRPTSPMSIGSWTLTAFGLFSGLAAVGQLLDDLFDLGLGRRIGRWMGLPGAASGALLSVYTGNLLAATSTPLWAAGYPYLAPLFGATGASTATAALTLLAGGAARGTRRRLDRLALVASALQLTLALLLDRRWRRAGVDTPLRARPLGLAYRAGALGGGMALPLAVRAVQVVGGRSWPAASTLAALATLGGGFVERSILVFAGNRSADRPEDVFRLTGLERTEAGA